MAVQYRIMPDGSYVFPQRGKPPPLIDGYVRDAGDPYHLLPDFKEPCKQRMFRAGALPCCKEYQYFYCQYYEIPVIPEFCNTCTEGDEIKK